MNSPKYRTSLSNGRRILSSDRRNFIAVLVMFQFLTPVSVLAQEQVSTTASVGGFGSIHGGPLSSSGGLFSSAYGAASSASGALSSA